MIATKRRLKVLSRRNALRRRNDLPRKMPGARYERYKVLEAERSPKIRQHTDSATGDKADEVRTIQLDGTNGTDSAPDGPTAQGDRVTG